MGVLMSLRRYVELQATSHFSFLRGASSWRSCSDEFHRGRSRPDPRDAAPKARDILIPDLHINSLKLETQDFR